MFNPTQLQLALIGENVCNIAYDLFCECGVEADFCIQSIGPCVVFGGTNRLIYNPKTGEWYPDKSYCSDKFLSNWDKLLEETEKSSVDIIKEEIDKISYAKNTDLVEKINLMQEIDEIIQRRLTALNDAYDSMIL